SSDGYPLDTRQGIVARTFRDAIAKRSSGVPALLYDDVRGLDFYLAMGRNTMSEATAVAHWRGRPLLVVNLESNRLARFKGTASWSAVVERAIAAMQHPDLVSHLGCVLFPIETQICRPHEYSSFEQRPEGILDVLDCMAAGAQAILTSFRQEPPECVAMHVFKSKTEAHTRLTGFSLSRGFQNQQDEFAESLHNYQPDRLNPTHYIMREAEFAKKGGDSAPEVFTRKVVPAAASCVPAGIPHSQFIAAPLVDHTGEWVAIIFGHFLREELSAFDRFASYQLTLYTEQLTRYLITRRQTWFQLFSSYRVDPNALLIDRHRTMEA
ncbi:MAG: hypothetical protein KJO98_06780, partial [Rhodothermia bacterium]|nr:hypothetical protein [Rhodothermia bacterium]